MNAKEWLEKICEKYGDNFKFPPYPHYFSSDSRIPETVTYTWESGTYILPFTDGNRRDVLYIPPEKSKCERPRIGVCFNGVVADSSKNGVKKVFLPDQYGHLWAGSVFYEDSLFGNRTLKKGEVSLGLVYRFEALYTYEKDKAFGCVALADTFDKNNLLDSLTHCNYQKNWIPQEKLPKYNPFKRRKKSQRKNINYSSEIDPSKIDHRSPWEKGRGFRR